MFMFEYMLRVDARASSSKPKDAQYVCSHHKTECAVPFF